MKLISIIILLQTVWIFGCASQSKVNHAKIEKYRHCYHQNVKLMNACIEKNEKGEEVTAMQLENSAYPGQYK
jgi:hypothetical protein